MHGMLIGITYFQGNPCFGIRWWEDLIKSENEKQGEFKCCCSQGIAGKFGQSGAENYFK